MRRREKQRGSANVETNEFSTWMPSSHYWRKARKWCTCPVLTVYSCFSRRLLHGFYTLRITPRCWGILQQILRFFLHSPPTRMTFCRLIKSSKFPIRRNHTSTFNVVGWKNSRKIFSIYRVAKLCAKFGSYIGWRQKLRIIQPIVFSGYPFAMENEITRCSAKSLYLRIGTSKSGNKFRVLFFFPILQTSSISLYIGTYFCANIRTFKFLLHYFNTILYFA